MFSYIAKFASSTSLQRASSSSLRLFSSNASVKGFIEKTVKENDLVVFMKGTPDHPMCGFSRAVCKIMNIYGIKDVTAINVLEDEEIRSGVKSYTSWPTIPQVFVKGNFIGGCDIIMEMHSKGELEELFVKEGLVTEEPSNDPSSEK